MYTVIEIWSLSDNFIVKLVNVHVFLLQASRRVVPVSAAVICKNNVEITAAVASASALQCDLLFLVQLGEVSIAAALLCLFKVTPHFLRRGFRLNQAKSVPSLPYFSSPPISVSCSGRLSALMTLKRQWQQNVTHDVELHCCCNHVKFAAAACLFGFYDTTPTHPFNHRCQQQEF